MAFSKPTTITKITFRVAKTGKEYTVSQGSSFTTRYQDKGDKFTGKTIFPVTIDGQVFMVPVSVSAKQMTTEKGETILVHVNQTDTISFVKAEEVAIGAPKAPAAPVAAPKGVGGAVVRPVAAPATTPKFRTL